MTPPTVSPLSEGLSIYSGSYSAGCSMAIHTHVEARFVLQLKGMTKHEVRQETRLVTPSTLLFIPAGEPHADCFLKDSDAFILGLEDHWLSRYQQIVPFLRTPALFQKDTAATLALRMSREAAAPDNLSPLMLDGLALELLTAIARTTSPTETAVPRWLRQAQEMLHDQFTEDLSMEALAQAAGVHPAHLMRTFRQHYRVTIGEYVRKLRIEHACTLLASSDLTVTQIAHTVGFHQQSHFCRAFKAQLGVTPSEFQKRIQRVTLRQ